MTEVSTCRSYRGLLPSIQYGTSQWAVPPFPGLRCPPWPPNACQVIGNSITPPSIAPCSVTTAAFTAVCVRVTPQAFRQLWQDCDWSLIVNEDFLFYQYTSLSAETYTPGPAVPDMTQIAIFSTASALNHTSV